MIKTEKQNLTIIKHPLVSHNLAIIRNKNSDCEQFKNALQKITYLLIFEATKNLPLAKKTVETPICETECEVIDPDMQLILAPILRAGLIFGEIAGQLLPFANIHHIGMYRNEKTLHPVWYYDKTKKILDNKSKVKVIILDPMLATGNSAKDAIDNFLSKGILEKNIIFMSLISSPQGIEQITRKYSDIQIITASLDEKLNNNGYIVPGLGDAGDRIYNTL